MSFAQPLLKHRVDIDFELVETCGGLPDLFLVRIEPAEGLRA
jgi:hypothetical protein